MALAKRSHLIISALLLLGAGALQAQAAIACDKVDRQDDLERCLAEELQLADRSLNAEFGALRRSLARERREVLKHAQNAWITLRDKDCEFEASAAAGGAAYRSLYLSCQLEATRSRLRSL